MLGQTQIMLCPEFKLGDDSGPVSVLELPLQPGDFFLADDTVFVIENDLASLEVPAPFSVSVQPTHLHGRVRPA